MTRVINGGRRPGWALGLFAGLLLAGVALRTPAQAPDKKPPKDDTPRQRVITLPSDADTDVREMVDLINTKLETAWKENKVEPSRPANDYEFIRRASLDIIGRIATPDEIAKFLRDPKETRRSLLIDRLLASPEYPKHWGNLWANWLLGRSGAFGRGQYHNDLAKWLADQFAQNRPYHEIVTALLTAEGKNTENPEVNFILAHVGAPVPQARRGEDGYFDMVPLTSRVSRVFIGIQTQCCQCHDHPFDANLKQGHFWGINVFLRQVNRQGTPPNPDARRPQSYPPLTLAENDKANRLAVIDFEKRNGVWLQTKADFFGKELAKGADRRDELARLIVAHPNFPKALTNRMWSVFFGKGFVNPIDDFNELNTPAHPELLNELSGKFKHYGYDLKKLIRWMCNSEAYSLSVVTNKTNDKPEHAVLFSRMLLKSMSPEQLFESLNVATMTEQSKEERNERRTRWLDSLVDNFGDDEGNEVNFNGTIVQALMMMNGRDINEAISQKGKGVIVWAARRGGNNAYAVVNNLYLAALNRPVGRKEYLGIMKDIDLRPKFRRNDSVEAKLQDLLWALLNSNEFLLNH